MPTGQEDRIKLLTKVGFAALVEAAKAVPGVGSLIAAAVAGTGVYLEEIIAARDLPKEARQELRRLVHDFRDLLESELKSHPNDNTPEIALVATLEILAKHGLSAEELVTKANLDVGRAGMLTLAHAEQQLKAIYDTKAQELTERLVREYYRILLTHKEALNAVGVPALRILLAQQSDFEQNFGVNPCDWTDG